MNSTVSSRTLLNVIASLAAVSLAASALAAAVGWPALPLFGGGASALLVLIAARDYAPRASYATTSPRSVAPYAAKKPRIERMPLAA